MPLLAGDDLPDNVEVRVEQGLHYARLDPPSHCNEQDRRDAESLGYPQAEQADLGLLFDNLSLRYAFTGGGAAGGSTVSIRLDGITTCSVTYVSPNAAGISPTITRDITGC